MPLFKTITTSGGLIGVWELTESSNELLNYFSPEEITDPAFQKYTHEKRRVEWLATRVLIRHLIGADFSISYSEAGKPILTHFKYKHLSISHSREFIAVYAHENLEVGIDIENTDRNYRSIEERYLSEAELNQVNGNSILQCLYWCAKEAIFKLVPEEGIEFKEQIQILPFDPDTENNFQSLFFSGHNKKTYQLNFQSFSKHGMVWVAEEPVEK